MPSSADERIPVTLVTGFLGSGKTTLIARLLRHPDLGDTAVVVNELGEVGLDHHLLRRVDERTVLLESGCLCCSLRGDLVDELADLVRRRRMGEIPPFRRLLVETTGLAEPAPIVHTLLTEPSVRGEYRLGCIVVTVDALHGLRHEESLRQVAAADVLVVTKGDLADSRPVERELGRLNPAARIVEAVAGDIDPATLFAGGAGDTDGGLGAGCPGATDHGRVADDHAAESHELHHHGIGAVTLTLDEQVDWTAFGVWLTMLLAARGDDVLRVKGLLDTGGEGPVLLNGVQHVVYPPEHLAAWPDERRGSRLVFIGRCLDAAQLARSLTAFSRASRA